MVRRSLKWVVPAALAIFFLMAVEYLEKKERAEQAVSEKSGEITASSPYVSSDTSPLSPSPAVEERIPQASSLPERSPEQTAVESSRSSEEGAANENKAVIAGTFVKGDTVGKLLGDWAGVAETQNYINATRQVFPLTAFRAGQPYVLVRDLESGSVKRFEYEIDQKRRLVVEGGDGVHPVARVEPIEYTVELAMISGKIDDNLFQSVADMGESPQLALQIANLFGWEINFIRDIKEGDSFSILFEKLYREGEFRGYGRTLGATFTNKGKTFEAFIFNDARGQENYYNPKGENLKKTLLQAPLSFTRVTSGYTKSRKHPIFGDPRAHFGVDYGAPTGTPVKAVGDGVITLRGWMGGYGNQVIVRHTGGVESMYSHLSSFGRGTVKGSRVRQGQVIGYVGSTGYATGPHLDFRLKQNGRFINPANAVNPRGGPVPHSVRQSFEERMTTVRAFMDGTRSLNEYTPELIARAYFAPELKNKEYASSTEEGKNKSSRKKRRE